MYESTCTELYVVQLDKHDNLCDDVLYAILYVLQVMKWHTKVMMMTMMMMMMMMMAPHFEAFATISKKKERKGPRDNSNAIKSE